MTYDPWPLNDFILRMGLGGGVAWWHNPLDLEGKKIVD